MDKVQRINITVLSSQDYDMVQLLSDLHGSTLSMIAAKALHEWLKLNFVKEVEQHQQTEQIFKKFKNDAELTVMKYTKVNRR